MARNLGVKYTDEKPFYFISYNTEDEKRVAEYAAALVKAKVPIWYDSGLKIGGEWEAEIAEKIDDCQAVIMFLSRKILEKEASYVHKEFELATEYSAKTVYVVMLDEIDKREIPPKYRTWWINVTRLQCINAYEFESPKECVKTFLEKLGIKNKVGEPNVPEKDQQTQPKSKITMGQVKQQEVEFANKKLRTHYDTCGIEMVEFVEWMIISSGCPMDMAQYYVELLIWISDRTVKFEMIQIPIYKLCDAEQVKLCIEKIRANEETLMPSGVGKGEIYKALELYYHFLSQSKADIVWGTIKKYEGETFNTKFMTEFSYSVSGDVLYIVKPQFGISSYLNISKNDFGIIVGMESLDEMHRLRKGRELGAYIYGILTDPRIEEVYKN